MNIAPIPKSWIRDVISTLRSCDSKRIEWTLRADQDWGQFGMKYEGYELLIRTLSIPYIIGSDESSAMMGAKETWAFLCPHPLNPNTKLYAKIGLKEGNVTIKIFSLHVDLQNRKLEKAIDAYHKKRSKKK